MFGWNFVKLKCKVSSIFDGGRRSNKSKEKYFRKKGD